MTLTALAGAVVRWTLFAAVLVSTGAAAFRFLVLGRLTPKVGDDFALRLERRAAGLGFTAAILLLLAVAARAPLQVVELRDPAEPLGPQIHALLLGTLWGTTWLVQLAVAVAGVVAFGAARTRRGAWAPAAAIALVLACSPAMSGHAVGSERLTVLAVVTDGLHVLGAAAWLGAMVVLFTGLALATRDGDGAIGSALVDSFSPLALGAAVAVGATGLFSAWLHLGTLPELWRSRYGLVLLLKLAAVALMGGLGAWNWRRGGPGLRNTGNMAPMRRSVRAELLLGALVLVATAILVVTPTPGDE